MKDYNSLLLAVTEVFNRGGNRVAFYAFDNYYYMMEQKYFGKDFIAVFEDPSENLVVSLETSWKVTEIPTVMEVFVAALQYREVK